ncbi:MAG TPA: GNAT family N-acetyltransferase [Kineosporiaceae bacterium]
MTTKNGAIHLPVAGLPEPVSARHANGDDEQALTLLWRLFRHHMSTWTGELPAADGTYRSEWLHQARSEPDWNAWLLTAGQHPIGLALTRAMNDPVHVLNSFFLLTPARGRGLGHAFAHTVVAQSPGRWSVAFQDANPAAARFWPRLAATCDPAWSLEHRPVPGRPNCPPDTWVTFTVGPYRADDTDNVVHNATHHSNSPQGSN